MWHLVPKAQDRGDSPYVRREGDRNAAYVSERIRGADESVGKGYDEKSIVSGTPGETIERRTAFEMLEISGGECVLDVGAGTLRNALYALELGAGQVCGMDLCPGMLNWGRRKAVNRGLNDRIGAVVGDARFIPFRDNLFDRVISLELVEHIPVEADRVFKEVFRVLKPGGVAVVNTWSVVTHVSGRSRKNRGFFSNNTFYKYYRPAEFRQFFADVPFRERKVYGQRFIPPMDRIFRSIGAESARSVEWTLGVERMVRRTSPALSRLLGRFLAVRLVK